MGNKPARQEKEEILVKDMPPLSFGMENKPATQEKEEILVEDMPPLSFGMGNKPATEEKEEILVKVMPPLDRAFVKWLARDLERIHGFTVEDQPAIRPPDHYIEYMQLYGWLDVDLDDPDLARLLR